MENTKNEVIKSFKGFDKDLKCRGFQFEIGKVYEEKQAKACECGFHACEHPLAVFGYYHPCNSRYCVVEQSGKIVKKEDKTVSTHIKIDAEIGVSGLVQAAVRYVKERCTNEHNAEPYKPATAGSRGAATAGDCGAATAGECGAATAGYAGAATAGSRGAATAGDCGAATAGSRGAATAGDCGAATSRGESSTGNNGVCVARGNNVLVKGGIGSLLVIAEEAEEAPSIVAWKAVVVDGDTIKADTWYHLVNGELKEVEE